MATNRSGRRRLTIALVAASFAVAGCGRAAVEPTPSSMPNVSVTPTPSPTPTLSAGAQAAVDKVVEYVALVDRLSSDSSLSINELVTVSRADAADKWRRILADYRMHGQHQTGVSVVTLKDVQPGQDSREWVVSACQNVSDIDVVDKDGASIVVKDRPPKVLMVYTVTQDPVSYDWFVTNEEVTGEC